MDRENIIKNLSIKTKTKIVLLVLDGLGDIPYNEKTALEKAVTPNLDNLAKKSVLGSTDAIFSGITPGSGPSHLALFGYDPLKYEIGRGLLEALGINLELTSFDLACRANFATKDKNNIITDRRAGRISTEKNEQLCALLQKKINKIEDVEVIIKPGKEHRFVIVFRGQGLEQNLSDADPQKEGNIQIFAEALTKESEKAASIINQFVSLVDEVLKDEYPANTALVRGYAKFPSIPSMTELFKLNPAAIATYPMYKGLSRLVGMQILDTGETIESEIKTLSENFSNFDFFYLHIKKTDSYGEDGNFEKKVTIIEEVDKYIPQILSLKPDVLVITADHSTPALLKGHSWHPNPFLLFSPYIQSDEKLFTEFECARGSLGRFPSQEAMVLMLAHALKLKKFGA